MSANPKPDLKDVLPRTKVGRELLGLRGVPHVDLLAFIKAIENAAIRDYLTSPAAEKALAEALVPDSTPEWRATEAKRLLAALVASLGDEK